MADHRALGPMAHMQSVHQQQGSWWGGYGSYAAAPAVGGYGSTPAVNGGYDDNTLTNQL
jgi:hypothetical protein